MSTLFSLVGATNYQKAESTVQAVTEKLVQKVQMDDLEVLSWTDTTITYHGVTRITRKSVLLTVAADGTLYAKFDDRDTDIVIGKIHA